MSRRMVQLLRNVADVLEEKSLAGLALDVRAAAKDYDQTAKELENEKGRYDALTQAGWNLAQRVQEKTDLLKAAQFTPMLAEADVYKSKYTAIYNPNICLRHGDKTFGLLINGVAERFCSWCGGMMDA